jgi:5-(carboxyamino)imidazole ribonucleotide synthase
MFLLADGAVVINELAPRVHNSGHYTIEACVCSQFENHVRAVLGWPLGRARARGHAAMINLIGTLPDRSRTLSVRGVHWHDYGKAPRPGRKLGHLTVVCPDPAARDRACRRLLRETHAPSLDMEKLSF